MQMGAFDYVVKPFHLSKLKLLSIKFLHLIECEELPNIMSKRVTPGPLIL